MARDVFNLTFVDPKRTNHRSFVLLSVIGGIILALGVMIALPLLWQSMVKPPVAYERPIAEILAEFTVDSNGHYTLEEANALKPEFDRWIARSNDAEKAQFYTMYGKIYRNVGEQRTAADYYEQAVSFTPESKRLILYQLLTHGYGDLKDHAKQKHYAELTIEGYKQNPDFWDGGYEYYEALLKTLTEHGY